MYGAILGAMTAAMTAKGNQVKQQQANDLAWKRTRESELNAQQAQMSQISLQNAYNSPAAQMQRLRDAGLNPMLGFQNGVNGNLSTGIGNMLTPAPASNDISPMSIDAGILASIDDYNLKKKELDLKATSQEFDDNLKKEQTKETKARRKLLLKDLAFKDSIEQDRHNESLLSQKKLNSDVIYQGAQTSLALQQKERLIEQAIEAKNQLFEQQRQFNLQMSYYKEHDASERSIKSLERLHDTTMKALDRQAQKAINDASNNMWYKVSMDNNDLSKFQHYNESNGQSFAKGLLDLSAYSWNRNVSPTTLGNFVNELNSGKDMQNKGKDDGFTRRSRNERERQERFRTRSGKVSKK